MHRNNWRKLTAKKWESSSLFIVIFYFLSCDRFPTFNPYNDNNIDNVRIKMYDIQKLSYDDKLYAWWIPTIIGDYEKDENGIIMFSYQGLFYYHPTQIAQKMLHFLASYHRTEKDVFLKEAEKFAEKIIDLGFEKGNAFFVPFKHEWPINKQKKMYPLWYSGMSQGQLLSAFIRLYDITGEPKYLLASHKLYNSLKSLPYHNSPWVAFIDSSQYFWIEEYPESDPNHVLNGFVFALFGIYDYYLSTESSNALYMLRAGFTTIENHLHLWRVSGDISKYSIKYDLVLEDYHMLHIELLQKIAQITNDNYFAEMAELFKSDFSVMNR